MSESFLDVARLATESLVVDLFHFGTCFFRADQADARHYILQDREWNSFVFIIADQQAFCREVRAKLKRIAPLDDSIQWGSAMRTLIVAMLLACAGTLSGFAQEDSGSDAASKIIAMEHVWGQAYAVKDPKALGRILDSAFVCVGSDGKLLTK